MFRLSNYWRCWSRILFHDAHDGRGMEKMREKYNIPRHVKTIEVDLTPVDYSGQTLLGWDRVMTVNVRCHSTPLGSTDLYRGSLDDAVLQNMAEHLSPKAMNALLHVDLLKYIDWDKYQKCCNGGAALGNIVKNFQTPEQYYLMQRQRGGGPGLLIHDVLDDYLAESKKWQEEIDRVVP
jgi:hypothetical protein